MLYPKKRVVNQGMGWVSISISYDGSFGPLGYCVALRRVGVDEDQDQSIRGRSASHVTVRTLGRL